MKIFEFAFNPKKKKDRFFAVFSHEPRTAAEKSRGSLYVAGELDQALEFNARFLQKLSRILQEAYYGSPLKSGAAALKAALKEANSFLAEESRKGNVDWLGNLHLVILVFITMSEKKTAFHLAKTGGMSVLLARQGALVDVGKNAEAAGQPGKVFGNIVSGNLVPDDSVLVQSRETLAALSRETSLGGLGALREAREFRDFFSKRSRALSQVSGIFLSFVMEEEAPERPAKLRPLFSRLSLPKPKLMLPKPRFAVPAFHFQFPWLRNPSMFRRRGFLMLLFLSVLLAGFLLFQGERSRVVKEAEAAAETIELLKGQARNALTFGNRNLANELFQEAWAIAADHAARRDSFKESFLVRKLELEEELAPLNDMKTVEEPELLFEVLRTENDLVAQDLLLSGTFLYVTNPFSRDAVSFNLVTGEKAQADAAADLKLSASFEGLPVFFANPNLLLSLNEGGAWLQTALELPIGFSPSAAESFNAGLYLLDKGSGNIIRYLNPLAPNAPARPWLNAQSQKTLEGASSFAIDGNIWALFPGGEIQRYFAGMFQESLELPLFPHLESGTVITTRIQLPYLYILDPSNQRVLVMTKFGETVRQYRLPKLTKLLDMAVSEDGATVYLLNGQGVYVITGVPE
ncbi:MAG: hypothetical protein Q8P12_00200 [bacterium]|nr:hypothetical protein [bacterium]